MKSQSSLEFLINYGWMILIFILAQVLLFNLRVFSPSQFSGLQVKGLTNFFIQDAALNKTGNFSIILASKTPEYITITSMEYDIDEFGCSADYPLDVRLGKNLTLIEISPLSECNLDADYTTMTFYINYRSKYGLLKTEIGTIKTSVVQ